MGVFFSTHIARTGGNFAQKNHLKQQIFVATNDFLINIFLSFTYSINISLF